MILSDSQTAIREVTSPMVHHSDRWVEIQKAQKRVRSLVTRGHEVFIDWVPGHAEAEGNEAADDAAKYALEHKSNPNPSPFVVSAVRYHLKVHSRMIWQSWYAAEEATHRKGWFRQLCPSLRHRLPTSLLAGTEERPIQKRVQTAIRRLRWADTICNKALKMWNRAKDSTCSECEKEDDWKHRYLECEKYRQQRTRCSERLRTINEDYTLSKALGVMTLLDDDRPAVLAAVAKFLEGSSLLEDLLTVPKQIPQDDQDTERAASERAAPRPRTQPTLQEAFARARTTQ